MGNPLRVQRDTKEIVLGDFCGSARLDGESSLVEGCKGGSLGAYEELYRVHGQRMKSIARNLMGNFTDAEDAVQETFLKIYRSVHDFKGQSAFTTWIYRILVNTCYDQMRKRKRQNELADQEWNAPAVGPGNHSLRLTLEKFVRRLRPRNRTVFLLFEVEGMKHSEIAEVMKIREGTSKVLLFEAKRELRRMMRGSASEAGVDT
jgi:RNA polymerase sigma-70 factor (ECF subfamily)